MKIFLILLILSLNATVLAASAPSLDDLSKVEADEIAKEFAANFVHTIVAPASSLGDIIGFEVGGIFGLTSSPQIEKISKEFDTTADIAYIPHAGLIGALSVPFGITGELNYIPETDSGGVSFKHTSIGLKWTFTNHIKLPFDLALRAHGSISELKNKSIVNNSSTGGTDVETEYGYETSSFGLNMSGSVNLLFLEPYLGLGYVSTKTDIKLNAATTVSIFDFSSAGSYSSENSGAHIFYGANFNLLLLKIGVEGSRIMDVSRYTLKLSAYF